MEIRKILDLLEAAPPQAGAVGAFGKNPNAPPGAAATPAAAPTASASPSGGGAVAAFGKTAMANAPGGTTSPAAAVAKPEAAANIDTAATAARDSVAAQVKSGAFDPSRGQTVQSTAKPAATPTAARPDVEAQKAGMFAPQAAQPVNNQSSGMTAQSQAQNTKATSAQATAPTSSGYTAQSQAQNSPTAAPTASPGAAAAMASKSAPTAAPTAAPAQTSDQIATAALNAPEQGTSGASLGIQGGFGKMAEELEEELEEDLEEELAEAFNDMLRLSGLLLNEKAPPGAKAERMVKHIKKGYAKDGKLTKKEKGIAYATAWKQHNKEKVNESVVLEAGSTLEHIIKKFKHETKNFLAGNDLDSDLYDALYDYYSDNGEMPYGVQKARDGDPYEWISDRFADEMQMHGYGRQTNMFGGDRELTELARLAGLAEASGNPYKGVPSEGGTAMGTKPTAPSQTTKPPMSKEPGPKPSKGIDPGVKPAEGNPSQPKEKSPFDRSADELTECGDMGMDTEDRLNVSTNMSSDGTRSVNISAQGDQADSLLQMLKMAGMRPHDDHDHMGMSEPEVIMVSSKPDHDMHDEMMDEAKKRTTRYTNTPDEEYQTVASITRQGNDLNREKKQFAKKARLGDNPMAESALDADLDAMLESILIRDDKDGPDIKRDPVTGRISATFPPPKKEKAPDQSELPLQNEPYHGPRSLKVDGERTGTEKEVDGDMADLEEQGSGGSGGSGQTKNPYPVGQDALSPAEKLNPPNNPNKSIVRGILDFLTSTKPGM